MSSDTPPRPVTDVLASDAERENAVARLNQAVTEGRLTITEFTQRSGAVYAARTRTDVETCLVGLPQGDEAISPVSRHALATNDNGQELLLGSIKRTGRWRPPAASNLSVKMGTVKLDFRDAAFSSREIDLVVRVGIGTIKVVVPENVRLIVSSATGVGARQIEDNPLPAGVPAMTVRLHATTGLGTVKVYVASDDKKTRKHYW